MPDNDQISADDMRFLKDAITRLQERFDTVHVFATRMDDDTKNEICCQRGAGSYLSRKAFIQEWVVGQDERIRFHMRKILEQEDHNNP